MDSSFGVKMCVLLTDFRNSQFLCFLFFFLNKLEVDIRFFRFPYRHMKSVMLGLLSIVMG